MEQEESINEEQAIKKWLRVLQYTSDIIPELPEKDYGRTALACERAESWCLKNLEGETATAFAQALVPLARRNEGPLEEVLIDGKLHFCISYRLEGEEEMTRKLTITSGVMWCDYGTPVRRGLGNVFAGLVSKDGGEWVKCEYLGWSYFLEGEPDAKIVLTKQTPVLN